LNISVNATVRIKWRETSTTDCIC